MPRPSLFICCACVVALAAVQAMADPRWDVGGSVAFSTGYDSNVSFRSELFSPVQAGFLDVAPGLGLWTTLGDEWLLSLRYEGSARLYLGESTDVLTVHALELPLTWWPLAWLRTELRAGADYYYTELFASGHAWGASGDLAAAGSWTTGEVLLGAGAHVRRYVGERQTDVTLLPRVQWSQGIGRVVALVVGYQFAPRDSTDDAYDLTGHRVLAALSIAPLPVLSFTDAYLMYVRVYEAPDDTPELLHANRFVATWSILPELDVFGRYDLTVNQGQTEERELIAHSVSAGLVWRWGQAEAPRGAPASWAALLAPEKREQAPEIRADGVLFRFRRAVARTVAVIGTFNQWDPAASPLQKDPDTGMWSALVPVASGAHEYGFLVDGEEVVEPPDAPGYVDSGFGQRNGLLLVP